MSLTFYKRFHIACRPSDASGAFTDLDPVRIIFGVWLVSCYAYHIFVLLSTVVVTLLSEY